MKNNISKILIVFMALILYTFVGSERALSYYNTVRYVSPEYIEVEPSVYYQDPVFIPPDTYYYRAGGTQTTSNSNQSSKPTSTVVNNYYYQYPTGYETVTSSKSLAKSSTNTNSSSILDEPLSWDSLFNRNGNLSSDNISHDNLPGVIKTSDDSVDSSDLTALSFNGKETFMPSSIWQWILVIAFILVIIILIRLISNKSKHKEAKA